MRRNAIRLSARLEQRLAHWRDRSTNTLYSMLWGITRRAATSIRQGVQESVVRRVGDRLGWSLHDALTRREYP